jgi:hypothetical protein
MANANFNNFSAVSSSAPIGKASNWSACVDGSRGRFENVIDLVSRLEIETRNGQRSRVWVVERTHVHGTDDSLLAMFSKS